MLYLVIIWFNYYTMHPHTRSEWHFSIRTIINGELIAVVFAAPICMNVGGNPLTFLFPKITYHRNYQGKRLWYMICKELM